MIKATQLQKLFSSMGRASVDREHFKFSYGGVDFDAVIAIDSTPFELLLGASLNNWACVCEIKPGYIIEMNDNDFFALCNILSLRPGKESLTSNRFLQFVVNHAPLKCSNKVVQPGVMRKVAPNRVLSPEDEKTCFLGWNDHIKDGRTARNFNKTEQYFGKTVANYCRRNNVSSMWTTPAEGVRDKRAIFPWESHRNTSM